MDIDQTELLLKYSELYSHDKYVITLDNAFSELLRVCRKVLEENG